MLKRNRNKIFTTLFLLAVVIPVSVSAASANLSHSFHAEQSIPNGSLVTVDPKKSDYIQLANTSNDTHLLGVSVTSADSLLAINPSTSNVQVAIAGTANVLVTNENGNIQTGDQVSASPFNGIGMEAEPGVRVIGIAQTSFPGNASTSTTEMVKDKSGVSQKISVGYIRLTIAIASGNTTTGGSDQVNALQKLIKSLTGKTIPTFRILLGMLVALLSFISLIALIYSSVYASIISVGRNPLARGTVFRTLLIVMGVAFLTIIIASITVYFLLR